MYLQHVAQGLPDKYDLHEPSRLLKDLAWHEHLARIYRLCEVHRRRNIEKLRKQKAISDEVYRAMLSLSSTETHTDIAAARGIIRKGGTKAASKHLVSFSVGLTITNRLVLSVDWLKNNEESNPFARAATYQPESFIPIECWKAGRSNTNGGEQKHRDRNRDGTNQTLLAGIMRGLQYDSRGLRSMAVFCGDRIPKRYQESTLYVRSVRVVKRSGEWLSSFTLASVYSSNGL